MPHSSSTSFMTDLGNASGMRAVQELRWCDRKNLQLWPKEFRGMSMHSDTCLFDAKKIGAFMRSNSTIYKQHIVPVSKNLELVEREIGLGARVAILTRDPASSVHAACERDMKEKKVVHRPPLDAKLISVRLWVRRHQEQDATRYGNS